MKYTEYSCCIRSHNVFPTVDTGLESDIADIEGRDIIDKRITNEKITIFEKLLYLFIFSICQALFCFLR